MLVLVSAKGQDAFWTRTGVGELFPKVDPETGAVDESLLYQRLEEGTGVAGGKGKPEEAIGGDEAP